MRRYVLPFLLAAIIYLAAFPAFSQSPIFCWPGSGSISQSSPCSAANPLAVAATITPSGTQNVNLTQILSAAVSATNPIFVSPATASTPWAVTGSGTAGTAAAGVVTVQGIASMTPLLATLSGTNNIATVTTVTAVTGITNTVTVAPAAAATGGATYAHVAAGQATTPIKGSAGTLYSICLNSAASATNTTTFYDNPTTSGTVIAIPNAVAATVPSCLTFGPSGIAFANGLTVITAAANSGDMTVAFK